MLVDSGPALDCSEIYTENVRRLGKAATHTQRGIKVKVEENISISRKAEGREKSGNE